MFLKTIRLKNFRGFSEHEFSFEAVTTKGKKAKNRRMSLVLGENGTGKSNFLKAIALVTAGRDAVAEIIGEPKSWVRNGCASCEIEATIQTKSNEERTVHLEIRRRDSVSKVLDRSKSSLMELDDALEHTNRSYFVLAYGASRRLNLNRSRRSKSSYYRHPRAQSVATLFNPDASLTPIDSWAMDMDYQSKGGASLRIIKKVMSEFLREVEFLKIDKKKGELVFKTPLGNVPMSQLSDGYQNIAAWIGDLLFRVSESFDDYKNPLNTRGLLLIDEIDLHLHPQWQRELLSFLRRKLPNFQIVATTHSPITAQQAQENELYYMERTRKKVSINAFVGNPKALLLHQLVNSELFGMTSDESVEMHKKKARFEKLTKQAKLSAAQKKEHKKLQEELVTKPSNVRSNMELTKSQMALLKQIHKELKGNNE